MLMAAVCTAPAAKVHGAEVGGLADPIVWEAWPRSSLGGRVEGTDPHGCFPSPGLWLRIWPCPAGLTEPISRSPAWRRTRASPGSPPAPAARLRPPRPGSRLRPQLPVAPCGCPALLGLVRSSAGSDTPGGVWNVSGVGGRGPCRRSACGAAIAKAKESGAKAAGLWAVSTWALRDPGELHRRLTREATGEILTSPPIPVPRERLAGRTHSDPRAWAPTISATALASRIVPPLNEAGKSWFSGQS